jgi:hypothetical protein
MTAFPCLSDTLTRARWGEHPQAIIRRWSAAE